MSSKSMSSRRWPRALCLWLLLALAGPLAAQAGDGGVEFRLLADADKAARADGVWVTLEAHNTGTQPASLLRWKLPATASDTPDFVVELDGEEVAYLGRRIKRAAPTPADHLKLAPGETRRFRVDLAQRYDFPRDADYAIGFRYLAADDAAKLRRARANRVVVRVEGRPATPPPRSMFGKVVTGNTQFVGCTAQRQTDLVAARNAASTYAADVNAYLGELRNGTRYTTWFGALDNARYALATSHFGAIGTYIDAYSPLTMDCTCTDSFYAYVYPTDATRTIYLCNAFWSAPLTGTDSRAGTLIHEASHFTVHGGTDDHAYGQAAAMTLATSSPALAVMNADSHEYLAENTPVREGNTPSVPRNVTAQPGNAQAVLGFDAPTSNGGAPITNYQYSGNNGASWTALAPPDAVSPVTIAGLVNGTPYSFRLRAVNSNGNGGASAAVGVTPNAPVAPPQLVLGIARTAPATPRLYDGLVGPTPNATYVLSLQNNGAGVASGIAVNATITDALRNLAWQCTTTGIPCAPASGSGGVALVTTLAPGQTLTVQMAAEVDIARLWAQLDARTPTLSRQLLEPANANALFRGTFE